MTEKHPALLPVQWMKAMGTVLEIHLVVKGKNVNMWEKIINCSKKNHTKSYLPVSV